MCIQSLLIHTLKGTTQFCVAIELFHDGRNLITNIPCLSRNCIMILGVHFPSKWEQSGINSSVFL